MNRDEYIEHLRERVKVLEAAVSKAASHVRPPCGDLYDTLVDALKTGTGAATVSPEGKVTRVPIGDFYGFAKLDQLAKEQG